MVIVGHWATMGHVAILPVYGNLGVRIFFVISGYLITTLLLREQERTGGISLAKFYVRRAYRILPAAVAFLIPVMALYWGELRWYDVSAAGLYMVNFDFSCPWFMGHLWSLSVEEQFYFLWPAVLGKFSRWRVQILLGVSALAPIFSAGCYFFKVHGGGYGTFPTVADNLAIGCLLAILAPKIPKMGGMAACVMLVLVLLVPTFAANTPARTLLMLFVLRPMMHVSIAGLVLHAIQRRYWMLNFGPVVFLGKISYSLYLWQQLFVYRPEPWPIYLSLPLALGFASASYFFVEQPMLRLRDKKRQGASEARLQLAVAGD